MPYLEWDEYVTYDASADTVTEHGEDIFQQLCKIHDTTSAFSKDDKYTVVTGAGHTLVFQTLALARPGGGLALNYELDKVSASKMLHGKPRSYRESALEPIEDVPAALGVLSDAFRRAERFAA